MTGFNGPDEPGSFDEEFLARYLGSGAGGPRGPVRRIDLTRLMSAGARELVTAAAQEAVDRGDTDLDALHLLLAATGIDTARQWL
ncbi:MAG: ATP-dependent Clp protease ATP-binding subunit ClpC, partial [Pseudonocardiales bacterium]|nr:ATP-dependent Clp protease ATP-binding subunit ClpC [Pseudonocardiales bacterium]